MWPVHYPPFYSANPSTSASHSASSSGRWNRFPARWYQYSAFHSTPSLRCRYACTAMPSGVSRSSTRPCARPLALGVPPQRSQRSGQSLRRAIKRKRSAKLFKLHGILVPPRLSGCNLPCAAHSRDADHSQAARSGVKLNHQLTQRWETGRQGALGRSNPADKPVPARRRQSSQKSRFLRRQSICEPD